MKRGIDAVKIDGCILKSWARAQRSAQHRRTRDDIRELTADTHDFVCIGYSLEILPMRHVRIGSFRRHNGADLTRLEARANDKGAIAPQSWINEVFGETLGLSLHANKERNPENHAAQTE